MEYYTMHNETDGMSLQDMIEGDMKNGDMDTFCLIPEGMDTNANNPCNRSLQNHFVIQNGVPVRVSGVDLQHLHLSQQLSPQIQMITPVTAQVHGTQIDLESSGELANLSWLQNMNLQITNGRENRNPNLLVNPQTGAPVHIQTDSMTQTSDQGSTPVQYVATMVASQAPHAHQHVYLPETTLAAYQYGQHQSTQKYTQAPISQAPATEEVPEKQYPKPVYSYSCLIALALRNSQTGNLPVAEIYNFMTENFPYFKTAPDGWKNSVRHNLSLNKCFAKVENPKATGNTRKGCLWALNPVKISKMMEEIAKCRKKDPGALKRSMANPDELEMLERGQGWKAPSTKTVGISIELELVKDENQQIPVIKDTTTPALFNGDLNGIDNTMTLDPALSDFAAGLQNGIWDDINSEDLNIDMPINYSPLGSSTTSLLNISSSFPATFLLATSPTTFLNTSTAES